jgi:hypothetical protein
LTNTRTGTSDQDAFVSQRKCVGGLHVDIF